MLFRRFMYLVLLNTRYKSNANKIQLQTIRHTLTDDVGNITFDIFRYIHFSRGTLFLVVHGEVGARIHFRIE